MARTTWVLVLAVIVLLGAIVLAAVRADARAYSIEWRNADASRPTTHLRVFVDGTERELVEAACGPQETCRTLVDLPTGFIEVSAQAVAETLESVRSPSARVVVWRPGWTVPPVCKADADGDGAVTTADFAAFLAAMGGTCRAPVPVP